MTARYIRIPKFVDETGYTARAVETKISGGSGSRASSTGAPLTEAS